MKTLKAALIFISAILFLTSCQKEVDGDIPRVSTGNDSTFIEQFTMLDTVFVAGSDTIFKFNFLYDGNKRLDSYTYLEYDPGISGANRILLKNVSTYSYMGSDTLPFRVISNYSHFQDPSRNRIDTLYLFYQSGMVVKDSVINPGNGYVSNEFIRLSNTRYLLREDLGVYIDTNYSYVKWQNGNLLKEIDSIWIWSSSSWDNSTHEFTYDNKLNPFRSLSLRYPTPQSDQAGYFPLESLGLVPSNNNILTSTYDNGLPESWSYVYGSNNLPSIARYNDGSSGYKLFYQYTRL